MNNNNKQKPTLTKEKIYAIGLQRHIQRKCQESVNQIWNDFVASRGAYAAKTKK